MAVMRFAKEYLAWHYGRSLRELWSIGGNFLWFGYYFFSLPLLTHTLFAPIYRLAIEEKGGGVDIGAILGDFIVTSVMRLVGFFARAVVLAVGVLCETAFAMLFIPAFLVWFALPLLVPGLFARAIFLFF